MGEKYIEKYIVNKFPEKYLKNLFSYFFRYQEVKPKYFKILKFAVLKSVYLLDYVMAKLF